MYACNKKTSDLSLLCQVVMFFLLDFCGNDELLPDFWCLNREQEKYFGMELESVVEKILNKCDLYTGCRRNLGHWLKGKR